MYQFKNKEIRCEIYGAINKDLEVFMPQGINYLQYFSESIPYKVLLWTVIIVNNRKSFYPVIV